MDREKQEENEVKIVDFLENNWWNNKRSDEVFVPDDWTVSMIWWVVNHINDLLRTNKKISFLEVWIGTWIIIKYFLTNYNNKVKKIVWLDIVSEAVENAKENLEWLDSKGVCSLDVSDLLKWYNSEIMGIVDFIYACLPQVRFVWTSEERKKIVDYYAHYYDDTDFKKLKFNDFGLWLNEQTIIEAKEKTPNSDILLNLAWRVNIKILFEMFDKYWYTPEIMYEKIIPQHNWTDLRMFVEIEKSGLCECEFFEDEEWTVPISAHVAEERRKLNKLVCHKIYVIKWIPKKS